MLDEIILGFGIVSFILMIFVLVLFFKLRKFEKEQFDAMNILFLVLVLIASLLVFDVVGYLGLFSYFSRLLLSINFSFILILVNLIVLPLIAIFYVVAVFVVKS